MSYELLKTLHVLGAVLFVGNVIVTALWKSLADRTRNAAVIGFSQRLVTLTDIAFTATGVVLLAVTGPVMAARLGGMEIPWVAWGAGLFAAAGLVWVAVLIPVQTMQARLARGFAHGGDIPPRYWRLARIWMIGGSLATVLPLAALAVMVMKPA